MLFALKIPLVAVWVEAFDLKKKWFNYSNIVNIHLTNNKSRGRKKAMICFIAVSVTYKTFLFLILLLFK